MRRTPRELEQEGSFPGVERYGSSSSPSGAIAGAHAGRRLAEALLQLEGAFSLVFLAQDCVIVARDPHGFRPLAMASSNYRWIVFRTVCLGTCAFDLIDAVYMNDVEPGEMVIVGPKGMSRERYAPSHSRAHCAFEQCISRADSIVFGRSVQQSREC